MLHLVFYHGRHEKLARLRKACRSRFRFAKSGRFAAKSNLVFLFIGNALAIDFHAIRRPKRFGFALSALR